jgi:hypothetical protein
MKAIIRRLCRLEEITIVHQQDEGPGPIDLIRERRRRRAEASGEPFEERPYEWHTDDQNGPLSVADILRMGRKHAAMRPEGPPR